MIYYNGSYFSDGIDVNKTIESKECDIFHCWNFVDKGLRFPTYVSNGFHDLLMCP